MRGFKFSEQDANMTAANSYKDRQEAIRDLAQKKQVGSSRIRRKSIVCFTQALLLELQNLDDAASKTKASHTKSTPSDSGAEIPVRRPTAAYRSNVSRPLLGKYRNSDRVHGGEESK